MRHSTNEIVEALRAARVRCGMSQRELSDRAGVPQSHISRIESGAVDLRLSSLVALSRALGLEVTLVPRPAMTAVNAIVRSAQASTRRAAGGPLPAAKELKRLQQTVAEIVKATPASSGLLQLQRRARELERLWMAPAATDALKLANLAAKKLAADTGNRQTLQETLSHLEGLRNSLVHSRAAISTDAIRPAYSLDEDEHG